METATALRTGVTSTGLYYEIRGSGPPVLMISGATGDAGHFTRSGDRLANEFTVVTYDRRGNSRSPVRGDPDRAASMPAQADDAAEIITEAGLKRAAVFGTSGGALIALELIARVPHVLIGAVAHEPPLLSVIPPLEGPDPLEPIVALAKTDPQAAVEMFVRLNSSNSAWDAIDERTRARLRGNGATLFYHELEKFLSYQPDVECLRSSPVPVVPLRSRDGLPFMPAIQSWLEQVLGVQGGVLSGHHAPYLDMPDVFAEELRPILRRLA